MRLGEKGRFRYAPALLLPQILNNFTSNYWPGFTPPQWPGFTPPLTLHHAEPRLARWLLMAWDRTHENDLNFTQEYLSEMIGTERTTVTAIAGDMQRKGLIEYSRGQVKILDRKDLEAAACD